MFSRWLSLCCRLAMLAAVVTLLVASPSRADAADTWTDPYPGIRKLFRSTSNQKIHAVLVDISRPGFVIRATRPGEGNRTVSSFANLVGATVAINGDWFANGTPHGLAVGQGEHWAGTADNNWSFIACTLEKDCHIDVSGQNQALDWRWHNVVGGNGVVLVSGGQALHNADAFYSVDRHPRSAIGITADKNTLIFVAVQGRRTDSAGMTFNEVADLMVELGARQAMMFDGGGSTTLVLGGNRLNALPSNQGSERTVANHLAIIRATNPDGRCEVANGRFCLDASRIATCEGGTSYSDGDCAVFGASCHETDGIGYCAHFMCQRPHGTFCVDGTVIGTCEYGRFTQGDCAFFGATCEDDGTRAYCVHPNCSRGGDSTHCVDDAIIATCVDGAYSEGDCSVFGASCEDDGTQGYCVHPFCSQGGNATFCATATTLATCVMGAYEETDCAASGEVCVDNDGSASCGLEAPDPELCTDALDNDGDGLTDCDDLDCAADPACQQVLDPDPDSDTAPGTDTTVPFPDASSPESDTDPTTPPDTSTADPDPEPDADAGVTETLPPLDSGCGCRLQPAPASPWTPLALVPLLLLGLVITRQRRR